MQSMYGCGYGFLEGPLSKAEADWVKQKKTMAKMLLKARGWILYEWAWYTYDDVLNNLIKDTDTFIMKDREYVSCKTDIILEAICEALKKDIQASVEYWIDEEHEISKGYQEELYDIESDFYHGDSWGNGYHRTDDFFADLDKRKRVEKAIIDGHKARQKEIEARRESRMILGEPCMFE